VDEASAEDAALVVVAGWAEVVDVAEDGTNKGREIRTMLRIRDRVEAGNLINPERFVNPVNRISRFAGLALTAFVLLASGVFSFAAAQQSTQQKTFASAEEACVALVAAVQAQDQPALEQILGPTAKGIISGSDKAEDVKSHRQFVEKYREMHRLVREPDGRTTLYIGAENWPVPIVFVRRASRWYIDPVASRREILVRRIGRNELETIEVCRELVNAQNEYYTQSHDGEVKQFALKFLSDKGRHNGLYWESADGKSEAPVGHLLTLASFENAVTQTTGPRPFHGYYFRILTRQGRHARGGAKNYVVNGRMASGFAFVAYPAEYRSSGVMTFIVNRDGNIYQKDLGPKTALRAKTMMQYDPDATWKKLQ
jgi:hypothetical protein